MAIRTYNPSQFLEQQFSDGLDYMIANVPASPTYQNIMDTVISYLSSIYPDLPGDAVAGIKSVMANTANDYINQKIAGNLNFDANGMGLIDSVLSGIKENTIESLTDFFDAATEQLAQGDINTISKKSLYDALSLANASNTYWNANVVEPGSWATYLNSNVAINYANIPAWVSAAYVAALSGFAQVQAPAIAFADGTNGDTRTFGTYVTVPVALAITCGKVMLKWAQRPVVGFFPGGNSPVIGGGCGCHKS